MIRYNIAGLATNVNFLMDLAAHPELWQAMWIQSSSRGIMISYNIAGLATNVNFLMDLAAHPEFLAGKQVWTQSSFRSAVGHI
jgi:pyruvate carboxylase